MAAYNGHHEALSVLADAGCDLDKAKHDGPTPAIAAAGNGHHEALQVLLRHGAHVNNAMCMQLARFKGHGAVVQLLLQHSAGEPLIIAGSTVRISGLRARPELNGTCGVAVSRRPNGRWVVQLPGDGAGQVALRPRCLAIDGRGR